VFEGRTFKADKFATWLATRGFGLPRHFFGDISRRHVFDKGSIRLAEGHDRVLPLSLPL
jgi:hypothetical protein